MSPVQSSLSLQWCLSGASALPSMTGRLHSTPSQQLHRSPSASVTVAHTWWQTLRSTGALCDERHSTGCPRSHAMLRVGGG